MVLLFVSFGVTLIMGYVAVVTYQVYRSLPVEPFPAVAYAYIAFRPLAWYLTRQDAGLTKHVRTVIAIMSFGGLRVSAPVIRRMHCEIDTGNTLGVCWGQEGLILIDHAIATGDVVVCFYVVAHEMGHFIDAITKRQGHPLFELIRHEDTERFANAVAWYCLEYMRAESSGRSFDWKDFAQRLPGMLASYSPKPMPVCPKSV